MTAAGQTCVCAGNIPTDWALTTAEPPPDTRGVVESVDKIMGNVTGAWPKLPWASHMVAYCVDSMAVESGGRD